MSRRLLYQDLAAVRAPVVAEHDRLRAAVGDTDEFWIATALSRLSVVEDRLFRAVGELGGWTRTLLALPAMLAGAAVTALVTRALGVPVLWIVVCSWVVAAAVEFPVRGRLTRLSPSLGRRRLDRFAVRPAPEGTADLTALPEALARARVRLVSAALREAGSKHWRPPYLSRAVALQPVLFRLAEADMLLCQAIDCLEIYLDADAKEPM
jgi:hypothetical protein